MDQNQLPNRLKDEVFRFLAQASPAAILVIQDWKIVYANPAAEMVTGFSLAELLGMSLSQIADPLYREILTIYETGECMTGGYACHLVEGKSSRREMKLFSRQGQERWVDVTFSPLPEEGQHSYLITAFDITDNYHAEQDLLKAKQELEQRVDERTSELVQANRLMTSVMEVLPLAVWIADSKGRIIQKNNLADEIWGGSSPMVSNMEGYRIYQGWKPGTGKPMEVNDWPLVRAVREGVVTAGEVVDIQRFDGEKGTLLCSAAPIYNDVNAIGGAVWVAQDIIQVRRLELQAQVAAEDARQRADELNAVITSIADGVTIFDSRLRPRLVNPAALEIYGFNPVSAGWDGMIRKMRLFRLDGQPIREKDYSVHRALKGETILEDRFLYRSPSGEERIILASTSPIYDSDTYAGVVAVWHDITERERLLEENVRQKDMLEAERSRLSAIIANLPGALVVVDQNGQVVLTNHGAEILEADFRRGSPAFVGSEAMPFYHLDGTAYTPRDFPLTLSVLYKESHTNLEIMSRRAGRQPTCLLVNSAPILDRFGEVSGAVAIFQDITQRKQAEEEIRRNAARTEMLAELSQAFSVAGLNYQAVLDTVTRRIVDSRADICLIRLVTEDGLWLEPVSLHAHSGMKHPDVKNVFSNLRERPGEGLAGKVFQSGQPVLVHSIDLEEARRLLQPEFVQRLEQNPVNSLLVAPLRAQGTIIGTLCVGRYNPCDPITAEDQAFFQEIADWAGLAIQNSRLYAAEAQRARELYALHQSTTALIDTLDLDTLLGRILDAAQSAIPSTEKGWVHLITRETGQLQLRAALGYSDPRIQHLRLQNGQDFTARAVNERRPLLIDELQTEPLPPKSARKGFVPRSAIVAPLYNGSEVNGALSLIASRPSAFSESDLRLLASFAATASAALNNVMLHSELQRLAVTDTLTGLLYRRALFDLGQREIERSWRSNHPISAIMLDIDNFKSFNDTYGHAAGDRVLQVVAERCKRSVRTIDILGRYGGDEFAILLPDTDLYGASEVAERILRSIQGIDLELEGKLLAVSVSMGVARVLQASGSLSTLLDRADSAMYAAKQAGGNRVEVR